MYDVSTNHLLFRERCEKHRVIPGISSFRISSFREGCEKHRVIPGIKARAPLRSAPGISLAAFFAFVALSVALVPLSAQDVPPTSIRHGSTLVPDSLMDMFDTKRPAFIRGFNWGPATRRVNAELHSNFWHVHNPFAWSGSTYNPDDWDDPWLTLNQSVPGMKLVVAPDFMYNVEWLASNLHWYKELDDKAIAAGDERVSLSFGGTDPFALTEAMGIRFQPELNIDTASFTPLQGDTQGAVFGFRERRLGVTSYAPPSTPSANITTDKPLDGARPRSSTRFELHADSIHTPTIVLDGSWPSDRFALWGEGSHHIQSHPFNGRRMYLAVNVRRIHASAGANARPSDSMNTHGNDVVEDDSVVLRVRITYRLCPDTINNVNKELLSKGSNTPDSKYTLANTIVFDSVASPSGERTQLPTTLDDRYRGKISTLVSRQTGTPVRELVITRRMLPRASDAHPGATILAHFIIDTLPHDLNTGSTDGKGLVNYNPYLLRDVYRMGAVCGEADNGRITNLNVQVVYEGRADVAIDWVQVGTENMTWLTQGWYDRFADTVYRQILKHLRAYNTQHAQRFASSGGVGETKSDVSHGLRIYRWFNRDEGGEQYWEGMRYQHLLFDSLMTTERGFGSEAPRYNHAVMSDLTWQGNAPSPDPRTIAPYYQHGYNASNANSRLYLNHEWGMQNIDIKHRIDYDARWGHHRNGSVDLPADTTTQYYPGGPVFGSGSWQQRYEVFRYQVMRHPYYLFDTTRPWIANPWVFAQLQTDDATMIPMPHLWRFPTGEEVRLELYSALILGAKGYAIFWGANKQDARRPADYLASIAGASMGFAYTPPQQPAERAIAEMLMNAGLASDTAGPDYLDSNNRTGLYQALDQQFPYSVANITKTLGVASNRLYIGFRSTRMAIKEVFDKTLRAEDTLAHLQLVTWFSKGFRTWSVGDTAALARIIRTDARGIQTRHPYRTRLRKRIMNRNLPDARLNIPDYENYDSTFVEISLLRDSASPLPDVFVLGVLNRRCNPFDYADTDVKTFVSYGEFEDALRKSPSKSGRYRQQGAREIVLRFNYSHPDGRPRRLHVRSMGEVSDPALGIVPTDTVIAQDGTLTLTCMPGEAKMLYVEPLRENGSNAR